ncbi:MAG: hypothetical protein KF855_00830 [Acidobacteria bacterium]|nr:hypothetical protein [Acidobacteriota bacterium]
MVKRKIQVRSLIATLGMIVVIGALGINYAQNTNESKSQKRHSVEEMDNNDDARKEIGKSAIGMQALTNIEAKESDWLLTNGSYRPKMVGGSVQVTRMSFEKKDRAIHVSIYEFESQEDLKEALNNPRSHGYSVPIKIGEFGEKIFLQGGSLGQIQFKTGSSVITIAGTADEKLAEKFAKLVAEALVSSQ